VSVQKQSTDNSQQQVLQSNEEHLEPTSGQVTVSLNSVNHDVVLHTPVVVSRLPKLTLPTSLVGTLFNFKMFWDSFEAAVLNNDG